MEEAITIKNFSKSFGRQKAVDDLSFSVYTGEICAFLGANGSGKTTTIRCLLDIYQADQGELLLLGKPYTPELNSLIGYLPEERGLYTRARVMELFIYFASLRGIPTEEARRLSDEYLERVEMTPHKKKKISELSSGMQQKVQIGLAIIHKPKILIFDEPFRGLDPLNRQLYTDIFRELKEQGTTIIYSTHVIEEAQRLADRIVIIKNGKRKVYGLVEEVRKSFGNKNIHLEFNGKLPKLDKLFTATSSNKSAEIIPVDGVPAQKILAELIKHDVEIISYSVDYPSLNEIFIEVTKDKHEQ